MNCNLRNKEIKIAMQKQQVVTLHLTDGEVIQGIPEACADRVKLRRDNGVIYLPLADIKHVSRVIEFKRKTDPTSI